MGMLAFEVNAAAPWLTNLAPFSLEERGYGESSMMIF
jgi:hypothetical protein